MFKNSIAKQARKIISPAYAKSFIRMSSNLPLQVSIKLSNGTTYEQPTGMFINNEYVYPKQKKTFDVISPSTEEHITDVYEALEEDIDTAVEAASAAFKSRGRPETHRSEPMLCSNWLIWLTPTLIPLLTSKPWTTVNP